MRNDLAYAFDVDHVDPDESIELLSSHFQRAEGDQRGDWYFPASADALHHVEIANDRIRALKPGPAFDAAETEMLSARVQEELLKSSGTEIQTAVLSTSMPVDDPSTRVWSVQQQLTTSGSHFGPSVALDSTLAVVVAADLASTYDIRGCTTPVP